SRLEPVADFGGGGNLVGDRVAQHHEPLAAAAVVAPQLAVSALLVAAKVEVLGPVGCPDFLGRYRPHHARLSSVCKLHFAAGTTPGTADKHVMPLIVSVSDASTGGFVDQPAGLEAPEVEGLRQRVMPTGREQVGEEISPSWDRLEAA